MLNKIGIGIITCDREEIFKKCVYSLPEVDEVVVVNDGRAYSKDAYPKTIRNIIQHKKNKGVGISKNDALKYLIDKSCDHIFLCEDDVLIKDKDVCKKYVDASLVTGLMHFNYAYPGPYNKDIKGNPAPKKVVSYGNSARICLHNALPGTFSYYRTKILREVGLMDTLYKNAYEHIDHTFRIVKAGYNPPFWYFPDLYGSEKMVGDLDPTFNLSVTRKNKFYYSIKLRFYSYLFKWKNGLFIDQIPKLSDTHVLTVMRKIMEVHGNKMNKELPVFS